MAIVAAHTCCKWLTDALTVTDRSSGLQLAAAVGAYFLEGHVHRTLQKGGSYKMRCGAACGDVARETVAA